MLPVIDSMTDWIAVNKDWLAVNIKQDIIYTANAFKQIWVCDRISWKCHFAADSTIWWFKNSH